MLSSSWYQEGAWDSEEQQKKENTDQLQVYDLQNVPAPHGEWALDEVGTQAPRERTLSHRNNLVYCMTGTHTKMPSSALIRILSLLYQKISGYTPLLTASSCVRDLFCMFDP